MCLLVKADKLWIAILFTRDSSSVKTCVDSQLILSSSTLLQKLILQADSWESYAHHFWGGVGGRERLIKKADYMSLVYLLVLSVNRNELWQG